MLVDLLPSPPPQYSVIQQKIEKDLRPCTGILGGVFHTIGNPVQS